MSSEVRFGDQFKAIELVRNSQEYQDAVDLSRKGYLIKLLVNDHFLDKNYAIPIEQRREIDRQFDELWSANKTAIKLSEHFSSLIVKFKTEDLREVQPLLDDLAILDPDLEGEVREAFSTGLEQKYEIASLIEKLVVSVDFSFMNKVEMLWRCFCAIVDADAMEGQVSKEYSEVKTEFGRDLKRDIDEAYRKREFPEKLAVSVEEKQQVKEAVTLEKLQFDQALQKIDTVLVTTRTFLGNVEEKRKQIEANFKDKDLYDLVEQDKERIEEAFSTRLDKWKALEVEVKEQIQKIEKIKKRANQSMGFFNEIAKNDGLPISNIRRFSLYCARPEIWNF